MKFLKLFFITTFLLSLNALNAGFTIGEKVEITQGELAGLPVKVQSLVSKDALLNLIFQQTNELFHRELDVKSEIKYLIDNKQYITITESTVFYRVELKGTVTTRLYIIPESWLKSIKDPPNDK